MPASRAMEARVRFANPSHVASANAWFEAGDLSLLTLDWVTPKRALARLAGPCRPQLNERGQLHIELGTERLPPVVAVVDALHEGGRRLELALYDVDVALGMSLASWASERVRHDAPTQKTHREELRTEEERLSTLRFLVECKAVGLVQTRTGSCRLRATWLDPISHELTWELEGEVPEAPFLVQVEGYNALYRVPVRASRQVGTRVYSTFPSWIEAIRSRRARRAPVQAGLSVAFDHPHWPELRVARDVIDLTQHGLSFERLTSAESIYPGLVIPKLFVETADGETIALSAEVKSARAGELPSFGCAVQPISAPDRERWLKLCEERLFPSTRRGAAEVWSVYRSSGYFGLSDTLQGQFEHLRPAYVKASRALGSAPQLGCQSSWPSSGDPKATVTNLRLTPSCWFSYHLAAQPDETMSARSAEVLRDLYRQYIEHAIATPGPRWQMAYVQHSAHWSMRVHVDIPRRYVAEGEALVVDFRALEVSAVGRCAQPDQRFLVRSAGQGERAEALVRLSRVLSPIYLDALDYAPDRFSLDAFKAEWARHGLERDRELLLAYEAGELVALGIVESAEPGLHLFGLLDTLRLHAFSESGQAAFPSLLDLARHWFRERGRRSFCYLEEEGQMATDERQIKQMSPAYLTLLSVDRLPEMLEKLYTETASR